MSTQPAYDPDPQVDGPTGARGVRCLVDEVVRTAAPRLGKTAVARIAGPITEAVVALRAGLVEQAATLTRPADLDNDKIADLLEQVVTTKELRDALATRGVTTIDPDYETVESADLHDAVSHVVSMWREGGAARTTLAERRLDGLLHRLDNVVIEWDRRFPTTPVRVGELIHGGPSARERCPDGTALRGAGGALVLVRGDQGNRRLVFTNEPVGDVWPARVLEIGGTS